MAFSPCGRRWLGGAETDEGSHCPCPLIAKVARPLTPTFSRKGRGGASSLFRGRLPMSAAPVELPRWADVALVPLVSVAAALLVAGLVVVGIGENPLEATALLLRGALGSAEGIGFTLYYATNFTDVDDKIIRRANETGQDPIVMAQEYADKYVRHLRDLNVLPADIYPKVTETMPEIIRVIEGLIERNYAYTLDGDVYFRVAKDDDYGKLSRRTLDEAVAGTRVAEDERKENPADFALWKAAKSGEPAWPSPWGPGRPG